MDVSDDVTMATSVVRGLVIVVAAVLLTSIGGAGIFASPVTVPALFVLSRSSSQKFRMAAAIVAALTVAESMWAVAYAKFGESSPLNVALPLLAAVATIGVFNATPATFARPARRGG
jgi:hypothetical protein